MISQSLSSKSSCKVCYGKISFIVLVPENENIFHSYRFCSLSLSLSLAQPQTLSLSLLLTVLGFLSKVPNPQMFKLKTDRNSGKTKLFYNDFLQPNLESLFNYLITQSLPICFSMCYLPVHVHVSVYLRLLFVSFQQTRVCTFKYSLSTPVNTFKLFFLYHCQTCFTLE